MIAMTTIARTRSDPLHEQVVFLFFSIVRSQSLWFRKLLAPYDVTPRQYAVLIRLREGDGETLVNLARHLYVDTTALSRTVSRMEIQGLITRTRGAADRRTFQIELTPAGRTLLEAMQPQVVAARRQLLAGLNRRSLEELTDTLHAMLKNVAATREVDIPLDEIDPEESIDSEES